MIKGWTEILRIRFCPTCRAWPYVVAQKILIDLVTREDTRELQYCNHTPGGKRRQEMSLIKPCLKSGDCVARAPGPLLPALSFPKQWEQIILESTEGTTRWLVVERGGQE